MPILWITCVTVASPRLTMLTAQQEACTIVMSCFHLNYR